MIVYQDVTIEIDGVTFPAITEHASGTTLHCGCCGLPWATVTPDGVLVVESRHGGRVHENRLSVAALAALAAGNGETNGETWGYSG